MIWYFITFFIHSLNVHIIPFSENISGCKDIEIRKFWFRKNGQQLKCPRCSTSGCKDIEIRKLVLVANIQFLFATELVLTPFT